MLYEGEVAPGRSPVEAQIATSFPVVPNLEQSSQFVSREPGKNFCGAWMSSDVQPTRATNVRMSRERREITAPVRRGVTWGMWFRNSESQRRTRIGKKNVRKFPAHPRGSPVKTPQETTGLMD